MDAKTWLIDHPPHWTARPKTKLAAGVAPDTILGEEDAAKEWKLFPHPEELFAPTESYRQFLSPSSLFLFGRRGTGKTAILNMARHQALHEPEFQYQRAALLTPRDLIASLAQQIEGSFLHYLKENEISVIVEDVWMQAIRIALLWEVYSTSKPVDNPKMDTFFSSHPRFSKDLTADRSIADLLSEIMADTIGRCQAQEALGRAIVDLKKQLQAIIPSEVWAELRQNLNQQGKVALVLIDTDELYPLRSRIHSAIHNALLDVTLNMYSESKEHQILVKVALPSELLPHLSLANQEKSLPRSVIIIWRYRDLVSLLAKRFFVRIAEDLGVDTHELELADLDEYVKAKELLGLFLPETTTTAHDLEFSTVAYIIRHTQKKPRQIISLMNTIMTLAKEEYDKDPGDDWIGPYILLQKVDLIRRGLHARLDLLVNGTLDIYNGIYDNAAAIVARVLASPTMFFSDSDLDRLVKRSRPIRGPTTSHDDVKRLLLESGVLGVADEVFEAKDPEKFILEAQFEYQLKDTVAIPLDGICVVHPMCYDSYRVRIEPRLFVYPRPSEKEEEELLTFRRR